MFPQHQAARAKALRRCRRRLNDTALVVAGLACLLLVAVGAWSSDQCSSSRTFAAYGGHLGSALHQIGGSPLSEAGWHHHIDHKLSQRHRQAADAYSTVTLRASPRLHYTSGSNLGKLAGAMKYRIQTIGKAEVNGEDARAIHNLLKSMSIATTFIQSERSDRAVAASVQKESLESRKGKVYAFTVREVEAAPEIDDRDIMKVSGTEQETAAALATKLSEALEERGEVSMAGIGPGAAFKIIEAVAMADREEDQTLTVTPKAEKVVTASGEKLRVVVYCQRRQGFSAS